MDSETNNQSTVPKKGPNDFIFGRVLGDGSFSTVSIISVATFYGMDVILTLHIYSLGVFSKGYTNK